MTSLMLVCAVAASLAVGVLVAYGACQAMFWMFSLPSTARGKQIASPSAAGAIAIEG